MNKGNIAVIIAILVALGLLGGLYLNSKGKLNLPLNTKVMDQTNSTSGQDVKSDKITLSVNSDTNGLITGKAAPFAEVFINDQQTKADAQGNFSMKLTLDKGDNQIVVDANDADGNVVEQNLTVTVN